MAKSRKSPLRDAPHEIGRAGIRISNSMIIELNVDKTALEVSGKVIDQENGTAYVIAGTLTEEV